MISNKSFKILFLLSIVFFIVIGVFGLDSLPIFADEAIYIRWAQLIIDDPLQYFHFALNDGKTPLFIWLLVPFQFVFDDQLVASRVLSVFIGLGTALVSQLVVKKLEGGRVARLLVMVLFAVLPYWYLHNRLALMDGLLVFGIAMMTLGTLSIADDVQQNKKKGLSLKITANQLVLALGVAVALLTKIPAILVLPALPVLLIFKEKLNKEQMLNAVFRLFTSIAVGGFITLIILFHPALPQLFSRGSDFLFPLSEVLAGRWLLTIQNTPTYLNYFVQYLSPFLLLLLVAGLFRNKRQKQAHLMFWSGFIFALPIILMGKVVYPRYFLPAAWFFTLAGVMSIEGLAISANSFFRSKNHSKNLIGAIGLAVIAILVANSLIFGFKFINLHLSNIEKTPYVSADYEQFLSKWSSGIGIKPIIEKIAVESKNESIAVATEGYFGTLPDGLLVYTHNREFENIMIQGIGQPVVKIPQEFTENAINFDRSWLVVNSDRLKVDLESSVMIDEYCRPRTQDCLQVWDITALVKSN